MRLKIELEKAIARHNVAQGACRILDRGREDVWDTAAVVENLNWRGQRRDPRAGARRQLGVTSGAPDSARWIEQRPQGWRSAGGDGPDAKGEREDDGRDERTKPVQDLSSYSRMWALDPISS